VQIKKESAKWKKLESANKKIKKFLKRTFLIGG